MLFSKGDSKRNNKVATANGTTAVTVAYPQATLSTIINFSVRVPAGTPATAAPFVATLTPGVGFTFKSTAGDTSSYNWREQ